MSIRASEGEHTPEPSMDAALRASVAELRARDAAPLSTTKRAALWAELETRLDRGRGTRAAPWLAATAAVTALVLGLWLWPRAAEGPSVLSLEARAEPWNVPLPGIGVAALAAGARARFDGARAFTLLQGAADFDVRKRPPGAPFIVLAGEVRVVVVGTRFRVALEAPSKVRVDVREGRVRVERGAGASLVGAGESWPSSASSPAGAGHVPFESAAVEPTEDAQRSVDTLVAEATRLAAKGRVTEARERLLRAAERCDAATGELAFYLRARLEARLGRYDFAAATLAELRRRFPVRRFAREIATSELEAAIALRRCEDANAAAARLEALGVPADERPSIADACD